MLVRVCTGVSPRDEGRLQQGGCCRTRDRCPGGPHAVLSPMPSHQLLMMLKQFIPVPQMAMTHYHSISLSLSLSPPLSLTLSLSVSHTHTNTYTHKHTHTERERLHLSSTHICSLPHTPQDKGTEPAHHTSTRRSRKLRWGFPAGRRLKEFKGKK